MGKEKYPNTRELLITTDGGGSNGHRLWFWKHELTRFTAATGLDIIVSHYPPGASKQALLQNYAKLAGTSSQDI